MTGDRHRMILWGSFAASICIHLFLLLPGMFAVAEAEGEWTEFEHELEEHVEEQEPPEEPERLGLESSTTSSMTWVGYEEYREHLAQLSEFDQARFVEASSPETSTPNQQVTPGEQAGTPSNAGGPPKPAASPQSPTGGGGGPIDGLGDRGGGLASPGTGPLVDAPSGKATPNTTSETPAEKPGKKEPSPPKPANESDPQPPGNRPDSGGGAPPTPPSDSPQPPEPDAADKASDATSTISVPREKWISGHPVASQGLELFPRKPSFTTLQTLAGARNMLVVIRFGKDGKPTTADILEHSGNEGIDAAIKASLYRWRAKGTRLDALADEQTIDITLELIMHRRRD